MTISPVLWSSNCPKMREKLSDVIYSGSQTLKNCLDLSFVTPSFETNIFVPDENYITYAIRKFMLNMPSPGNFQI